MASHFCLLGPSELRRPNLPKNDRTPTTTSKKPHPSVSLIRPLLNFVFDENKSPNDRGDKAWDVDPLKTLKLILTLREAGKIDRYDHHFYNIMLWLHKNHPLTLALNLKVFGDLGLFEDVLMTLLKVLGESIFDHYLQTPYGKWWTPNGYCYSFLEGIQCTKGKEETKEHHWLAFECRSEEDAEEKRNKALEEVLAAWRRADDISTAKIAVERYQNDHNYRNLHNHVADLFAEVLKSDIKFLETGEIANISSASKFLPSIHSKFDKLTLICEAIAMRIFPREDYEEYKDVLEPHYAYRVRNRLQKQVLVPLRKVLKSSSSVNNAVERKKANALSCLETFWEIYNYNRTIKSMSELKERRCYYYRESNENIDRDLIECRLAVFKSYMKIADRLGMKIGDHRLKLPHQVVAFLNNTWGKDEIAELQWQKLVQEMSNKGKLRNCVAVCDGSLSLIGTDKEMACIGMGLLISEMSENPWKGMIFSFTGCPKIHKIVGESFRSKCEFMRQMECDEKVDCLEIYNRVLEIAVAQKLSHLKMPKRIFVFTYKDFVETFKYDWLDDYTEAYNNYRKRGFELNVPELVFWNLKDSIAEPEVIYSPVKETKKVGIIITGFSSNLLRLFLKGEADSRSYAAQFQAPYGIDLQSVAKLVPRVEDVFDGVISREELESLVLFD